MQTLPPNLLGKAAQELIRVTKKYLIIGVPFDQDTRVGRTTCSKCGKVNPPWGHVNVFSEDRLRSLFSALMVREVKYAGRTRAKTNFLSSWLMDLAGNPYGTYVQDEGCGFCGDSIGQPIDRNLFQKILTKIAHILNQIQRFFVKEQPYWINILFEKKQD